MKKWLVVFLTVVLLVACLSSAWAADSFNAQLFRPSIFGGNFIAIEDANTLCPLGFGGGLIFNYGDGPVLLTENEDPEAGILNSLFTMDALLAFGPFSWMSLGVDVPIHLYARGRTFDSVTNQSTEVSDLESQTTFMGDIRGEIKFRLLRQDKHWLGLALAPYITFPTGEETKLLGEGRITYGGNAILEHDFKVFNLALNGGYLLRNDNQILDITLGDAWQLGAGLSKDIVGGLSASVEYWGAWYDSGSQDRLQSNPMEVMGTLRYKFGDNGPRLIGGAAGGLTSGLGTPAYRLVGGIDYYHCRPVPTQGKLIVKVIDQNGDKISADMVISGPGEKKIDVMDADDFKGKLDPGNWEIAVTKSGYENGSAKTTLTIGESSVVTVKIVKLPDAPTVLNVTIIDNMTGNKLPGSVLITKEGETGKTYSAPGGDLTKELDSGSYALTASAEGFQNKTVATVLVKSETNDVKITLNKMIKPIGNIYFDFNSAVIRTNSYPVLDEVVEQINLLGSYSKITIEGHTSAEGTDEYNANLSKRRAQSVKNYLTEKGLDAAKLYIVGMGESQPIATNDTEEGRAQNRRVEFIISK